MATITTTEAGASGRYIDLGSPASQDDIGAQTIIVYCKPADQSGQIGYFFAKGDSTGNGIRLIQNTVNAIAVGSGSSTSTLPQKYTTAAISTGSWTHIQATWDGSLNGSGFNIYFGAGSSEAGTASDGTGSIASDASRNVFLLNRTGLGRSVLGDVGYVARWNRVLSGAERTTVRADGPLAVPSGLILCFANGQDYSSNAVSVSGRTTQVAGSTPTNTALGPTDTTISATVGNAVAAGITASVVNASDTTITATVGNAVANGITASVTTSSSTTISATVGNAVAAGITATIQSITLSGDYERSSYNPTGSSISGTGDSAIISINPKLQESEVTDTRWLEPSVEVSGVNGFRPTFRFLAYHSSSGGMHGGTAGWDSTRRPMYSYDNGLTWTYFDTAVTLDVGNQWIEFRNSAAFTGNTVRIGRGRQISVHQVGDWVAAFAAAHSEFVPTTTAAAYTPTGSVSGFAAQSFIADEFATQTDSLGATVPVTPLYAGVINDTALMPLDGSAKRTALITGGVHGGEDLAHWVMVGLLDYVMGASAEAQALRRRYKILVYPMINAPGRAGGGWRGSWTQGTAGADDPNRHWHDVAGLEIVSKTKTAIAADIGTTAKDWSLDFHGYYPINFEIQSLATDAVQARFVSLLGTNSGQTVNNVITYNAGYFNTYARDTLGFKLPLTAEHGDPVQHSDAVLTSYGAAFVTTLATMSAEGAFSIIAEPGNAVAAGITATITAAGTTTISATPGNATAEGITADILRKIMATPGNAVADGVTASVSSPLPTVGRPTSDTSNTGWTASTGSDLYAMVDEVTPDAVDYISAASVGAVCNMALNATAYPGTSVQQLKYRASSSTGNSVIVRLKEGATTIRSATQPLTATDTEYTITLTSGEIAAITSGALSVELESA